MPSRQDEPQTSVAELDRKIVEFGNAIALNPNNADAYRNRGLIYGRKQDYDRALSDFDSALLLNPNDARAHALRGLVRERKGDGKRAIADFDRAIEIDPAGAGIYRTHRQRILNDAVATTQSSKAGTPARVGGRFNLLLNPFVLLNVEPNATAQAIKQATEDALEDGNEPPDVIQRAQQILLIPRLRVDAEVSGFLDVAPELAKHIILELKKETTYKGLKESLDSLHALPRSNVLAHLGSASPMGVAELLQLLETQTIIAAGAVFDAVNEAREEQEVARSIATP
jgi:tetratricopeptide (TPR) repeat protein